MNITSIPDRLRDLADSLEGDEWSHPLCSVEACRIGATIAREYLSQCEQRLKEQLEIHKLREGFAWTKLKEEIFIKAFWDGVDYSLRKEEHAEN